MSPSTPVHSSSSLSWQSMAITLVPTPHIHAHTHTHIRTLMYTCSHTQTQSAEYTSVSPLWALACFRKHFYMRLGICWLHVFVQGVFKSTVLAILRPLSAGELRSTPHTYLYIFTLLYDINSRSQRAPPDRPSGPPLFLQSLRVLILQGPEQSWRHCDQDGQVWRPDSVLCLTGDHRLHYRVLTLSFVLFLTVSVSLQSTWVVCWHLHASSKQ